MIVSLARFVVPFVLLLPMPAIAAGLPPWRFGMSKAEVVSFKESGPYKDFKNGDVETFNGNIPRTQREYPVFLRKRSVASDRRLSVGR